MFKSKITKIGELAGDIFNDENMIILFYDDVPKDLHDIAVLHNRDKVEFELEVGDKIIIGTQEYDVIDIGANAKNTIKTLGHCTLKFTDELEVNLPGEIILSGMRPEKLEIGMTIEVQKTGIKIM